jgi:hypothetical protein
LYSQRNDDPGSQRRDFDHRGGDPWHLVAAHEVHRGVVEPHRPARHHSLGELGEAVRQRHRQDGSAKNHQAEGGVRVLGVSTDEAQAKEEQIPQQVGAASGLDGRAFTTIVRFHESGRYKTRAVAESRRVVLEKTLTAQ